MSDLTSMRPELYQRCTRIATGLAILGVILTVGLVIMMANIQPGNPGSGGMILFIFLPLSVFGMAGRVWYFGKAVERIDATRAAQLAKGARVASVDWVLLAGAVVGITWVSFNFSGYSDKFTPPTRAFDWTEWGFLDVPTVLMIVFGALPLVRQARGLPKLDQKVFTRYAKLAAFVLPLGFYVAWLLQQPSPS